MSETIEHENSTGNRNFGPSECVFIYVCATKDGLSSVSNAPTACRVQASRQEAEAQRAGPDLLDDPFQVLGGVEIKAHHRQA